MAVLFVNFIMIQMKEVVMLAVFYITTSVEDRHQDVRNDECVNMVLACLTNFHTIFTETRHQDNNNNASFGNFKTKIRWLSARLQ